uniref:Uncharacterized protein n=1 Tax=Arundo donax TaxID=35708 RepID=A0A0A9BPM8_ARUDO
MYNTPDKLYLSLSVLWKQDRMWTFSELIW